MRQCPHGTRGSKQSRWAETAYAIPSSFHVVSNQVLACRSRLRHPSHIIYLCERCRVEQRGDQRYASEPVSDNMMEHQQDTDPSVGKPGDDVQPPERPSAL